MEISVFPIEKLNMLLVEGAFDFIKASSIAIIRSDNYASTCVGASLAREKGPQLVKRKKSIDGMRTGVPSFHSTGFRLAKKYFPHLKFESHPLNILSSMLVNGEIAYALIVNEDMNRLDELGLESVCDLGLRWNSEHNAVLPLGLYGAHKRIPLEDITNFERLVDASVDWARKHVDEALALSQTYTGKADINIKHIHFFTKDAHLNLLIPKYIETLKQSLNI